MEFTFPTHVGMNRRVENEKLQGYNVPHTRGDEPKMKPEKTMTI